MAFSATEAAFEGFRLVKREPKSVLAWAGVQLVFSVALALLMLPAMQSIQSMTALTPAAERANPSAVFAAMGGAMGAYALIVPLELSVFAVLSAAVYRAVLRPEDRGVGRLNFGGDELRLMGLWILMGLLMLGVAIGISLVAVIVGVGAVAAAKSAPVTMTLVLIAVYLVVLAVFAWIGVRLSLAGPMTFAQKKVQLFGSWRLTKGRFWSLFGCYLLAFVFIVIIGLVSLMLQAAVSFGAAGGSMSAAGAGLFRPDFSSMQAYFSPARLILLPISAVIGGVSWAVMVAPAARAYKDIIGLSPESQADAFS
jgi:hypothetical protein